MTSLTDRLKRLFGGQEPDASEDAEEAGEEPIEPHRHSWSSWEEFTTYWELKIENWEDGENRPYIEQRVHESSRCTVEGCDEFRKRNEETVRQYLAIEETEVLER